LTTRHFDQLDVYRAAIRYVGMTRPIVLRLRRVEADMADQLHRSALSVPLNIAEGAGEFSRGDKNRFYRYALRSTAETIAILDVTKELKLVETDEHWLCRDLGTRIVAMMTKLVLATRAGDGDGKRTRKRLRDDE
jgi:four helix bundle protein